MIDILIDKKTSLPEGYTTRSATLNDVEIITALEHAVSMETYGTEEPSTEYVHVELQRLEDRLADSTRLVFSPDGNLQGYANTTSNITNPVRVWVKLRLHPDADSAIGVWLMQWAESQAHHAIEKCPPDAMVAYQAGCKTGHPAITAIYEQMGMEPIRDFYTMLIDMQAAPPKPVFPEGIGIRTYRHDADLRAMLQADEAIFRDHWGYFVIPLDENVEIWRRAIESRKDFDEKLWFMAMDDATGKIAGLSLNYPKSNLDPEIGFIDTLGVVRDYRRQGLGLALLYQSFNAFWERGITKVALGVDGASLTGAVQLYEKGGMHVHRQFTSYRKIIRDGIDTTTVSVDED